MEKVCSLIGLFIKEGKFFLHISVRKRCGNFTARLRLVFSAHVKLVNELKDDAVLLSAGRLDCLIEVVNKNGIRACMEPVSSSACVFWLNSLALRANDFVLAFYFEKEPIFLNCILILAHYIM